MANMNDILARQKTYINDLKKHINDKNTVDIVLNLAALNARSKTRLKAGNRIIVISDPDHSNAATVYAYDATNNAWTYVESLTANYYTKAETDALFNVERGRLTALETEVGPQVGFGPSTLRGRVKLIEDANYQSQIDAINAGQNLADIVANKSALNSYTTTNLRSGDKVQVLADESVDATNPPSTVYNWDGTSFSYIGRYGQDAYTKSEVYTKTEADTLLFGKVDKIDGKGLSTNDFTNIYKGEVDDNTTARHTHSNKSILDQITQDVVDHEHSHSNKALLDTYTQTEVDLSDAVSKKHSHSNKSILDQITQDVVDHEHSHSNKSILDATTASYTTAEQTKLAGIEAGAQVNVPADLVLNANSNNAVANSTVTQQFTSLVNMYEGKGSFVLSYATASTDNSVFNSDNNTITITSSNTIKDINNNTLNINNVALGTIFLVTETDKPDRWVGSINKDANDNVTSIVLYKMETTKVDLSPYATAVSYDSTNKKITYTKGNTAYDVISIATIKIDLQLGAAADKGVADGNSSAAFSAFNTNLITERAVYNGTPSINNSKTYNSATSIYAPTSGGTAGQILKSAGSTSTPVWGDSDVFGLRASGNFGKFYLQKNSSDVAECTIKLPTNVSAFTNDAGYLTSHQDIKTINGNSILGTGDITISSNVHLYLHKVKFTQTIISPYATVQLFSTKSTALTTDELFELLIGDQSTATPILYDTVHEIDGMSRIINATVYTKRFNGWRDIHFRGYYIDGDTNSYYDSSDSLYDTDGEPFNPMTIISDTITQIF